MLLKTGDTVVVKANALEDTVTVKEAVIKNGNLGVAFMKELAIDVNLLGLVAHKDVESDVN